jgi:hypothetical protein
MGVASTLIALRGAEAPLFHGCADIFAFTDRPAGYALRMPMSNAPTPPATKMIPTAGGSFWLLSVETPILASPIFTL